MQNKGDGCVILRLTNASNNVCQKDNYNIEQNPNERNRKEQSRQASDVVIHGCWRVNIAKQRLHRYWAVFIIFFALGHTSMTTDTGTTQPLFSQHLAGAVNLMQGLIVHIIHFFFSSPSVIWLVIPCFSRWKRRKQRTNYRLVKRWHSSNFHPEGLCGNSLYFMKLKISNCESVLLILLVLMKDSRLDLSTHPTDREMGKLLSLNTSRRFACPHLKSLFVVETSKEST